MIAVTASTAGDADKQALNAYFESAATSLINRYPDRGAPDATLGVLG